MIRAGLRYLLVSALLAMATSTAAQSPRQPRPPQTEYAPDFPVEPPKVPTSPPALTTEYPDETPAPPPAAPALQTGQPASACAALPESGPVPRPAAQVAVPARPTADRSLHCDAPFRLDTSGRMPQCVRPGIKAVDGNPREVCNATMPFGPIADVAPRSRPTRSCTPTTTETIVRLDGANLGWADVTITAVPNRGVKITTLSDTSDTAPMDENPVLQGCFAFQCRLLKLTIDGTAPPQIELRATLPGRDYAAVTIKLPVYCSH